MIDVLDLRLSEAGEEELEALVRDHVDDLDARRAAKVLRNRFVTSRIIELLLGRPALLKLQEVRRLLAVHPRTPEVRAIGLVSGLFWRDLVRIGADSRARPQVRRAADLRLAERLPGLAIGEKVAIARTAGQGVISRLRHDPERRVIASLLENPRLTEGALAPLVSSERARPQVLELIARDRRWGARHAVRSAIARNPRTPVHTALGLLSSLKKDALRAIAADTRMAPAVRRRAGLLLGRDPG